MKAGLIILAVVACAHQVLGTRKGGLRARFDLGLAIGRSFFYDIPRTVSEAKAEGWTSTIRPKGPLSQLSMYCPIDHVLCTLYDDTDYVAGLQIGISQEDYSDAMFDWKVQGFTNWTANVNGVPKNFWTIQQYFVSEEFLKISKEERLAARDPNKTLQAGAVWVSSFYGELFKISANADDIINNSPFTRQSCIPWMGRHYYYNMTKTTECASDTLLPWFPIIDSGELIAIGYQSFGKIAIKKGERNWFEDPDTLAVKVIVPNAPECFYNSITSNGAVTMHVYYIDKPWLVSCIFQ